MIDKTPADLIMGLAFLCLCAFVVWIMFRFER